MSVLNKIYDKSPVFLQNIFCSAKGYLICRKRYNQNFYKQLKLYEEGSYTQEKCLKCFVKAISDVPYYKKLFKEYNFDGNAIDIYEELRKLPILTKNLVKANIGDITNEHYKGDKSIAKTSGTTGGGLVFPYSREMENRQWAVWWRYRRQHGIDLNTWCGWFGGRSIIPTSNKRAPFWRINLFAKQVMFSAYHLNKETVFLYCKRIREGRITWLHGYPSQISLLASLILENKMKPINCVTHITFGAENLLENQKVIIKKAFPESLLCQHYGLAEGVANISENVNGELIIDSDFCYVEFLPVNEESPEICHIVGTGFSNEAFPLVRYDTGDIAVIEQHSNGQFKICSIDGRKEDFIILPNGVKLGRLDHIFKELTKIREAQIIQKDLRNITVKVVKNTDYDDDEEKRLWSELRSRIDETVQILIEYTDKIQRTKSGKLRFVISELNKDKI